MPGLFSYKKADKASKFLTSVFNSQINGDIIDLGAGWGFLSSMLLKKCPGVKSVTLVDHDKRAINCAKENIESDKVNFHWLDITSQRGLSLKFDYAICNPPFHSHRGKNVELGKSFIKAAHNNLKSSGILLLVANIQLPYENIINTLFHNYKIQSQNRYYKIILAKRPKKCYDAPPIRI